MIVRKTNDLALTGWPAVGVVMVLTTTKVLTVLVMSFALEWLVNHIFAAGAIHAIFGTDHFTYWRCVGLFGIWFATRVKIKFSGLRNRKKKEM